jgi:DNA invertase Pin-like site-specific DNA recombinase
MALVLLGLLAMPVPAHAARSQARHEVAMAAAGWHGRAIQTPQPRPHIARADWPKGWSARSVGPGSGYSRPGGSERVREVQRRLIRLGYRPGPVDGLFGPRTRAATRWFQYKHGLALTGRVNRSTLVVLQARSEHRPLPTETNTRTTGGSKTPRTTGNAKSPKTVQPAPVQAPAAHEHIGVTWLVAGLLLIAALGLGVVASFIIPELRRDRPQPAATRPEPPPALPPARPRLVPVPSPPERRAPAPTSSPPVVGYAMVDPEDADAATAALALRCAHRGWSLVEVIHDRRDAGRGLTDRPGLTYAVNSIRSRRATGLIVARIRDVTHRVADLATLLKWLAEADGFLGAADHELDTSTRAGRGTAGAVIEIARWERERISHRTREDLARGRFTPADRATGADITEQIAVMHERGLSFRAIADALNLVGFAGPAGRTRWRAVDVKAATEESRTS